MQAHTFDYAVFVGRFEPFHNAHRTAIERALELAKKVIVLIGSAGKPRTVKNPFYASERKVMIRSGFEGRHQSKLLFGELRDFPYNDDAWFAQVQRVVADIVVSDNNTLNAPARVVLVGHDKGEDSFWLKAFPQWHYHELPNFEQLNATELRKLLFELGDGEGRGKQMMLQAAVPEGVYEFLTEFAKTPAYAQLVREHQFIESYKKSWSTTPYPVTFVTVDAVCIQSGHVLLVKRRAEPGKGLWALPGGFIGQEERLLDACMRELREETRLKVPEKVLRGSIRGQQVFDLPGRSSRGRTITHAFYFHLDAGELPPVKGSDDAEKAKWVPLAEALAMESEFFEDHHAILSTMTAAQGI